MDQHPDTAAVHLPRSRETLRIGIIGAGFGGIGLAILLKKAGFAAITILEGGPGLGGTWRDNTYPGAACDVPSHLYSFSFAPKPDWSSRYASQAEILAYLEAAADRFGLRPHLRLNTPVTEATFGEATQTWRVRTASGAAQDFDILVSAVGQLSRPVIPGIPGLGDFAGPYFHSARWDAAVPLAGRRIALIGSAASAIQIAPELAAVAGRLTIFQRTPNWIIPRFNGPYGARRHAAFARLPGLRRAFRFALWQYQELLFGAFRTGSRRNAWVRRFALFHLRRQVADADLRRRLTPDYALGCKRLLVSDDFYPIFSRPNVTLVTDPILAFEKPGIRTADGVLHEADLAVFATGFDVRNCLAPVAITGRDSTDLQAAWRDGPAAYHGIAVPGFPNFFMLYGPNTNLGHNSIILMLEAQSRAIRDILLHFVAGDLAALEVSPAAHARTNADLQRVLAGTVWASGCRNWYGEGGHITANWSGSTRDYIRIMRRPDLRDFAAVRRSHTVPA